MGGPAGGWHLATLAYSPTFAAALSMNRLPRRM